MHSESYTYIVFLAYVIIGILYIMCCEYCCRKDFCVCLLFMLCICTYVFCAWIDPKQESTCIFSHLSRMFSRLFISSVFIFDLLKKLSLTLCMVLHLLSAVVFLWILLHREGTTSALPPRCQLIGLTWPPDFPFPNFWGIYIYIF